MRVVLLCLVAVWLWQGPTGDPKKSIENGKAGQAPAAASTAPAKSENPVAATADSLAAGKKTYGVDCAMCHGSGGAGDGDLAGSMSLTMKDLRDPATVKEMSDKEMYELIDKGKGKMLGEEGRLKPEQVWNVVNYVRSLAKKS